MKQHTILQTVAGVLHLGNVQFGSKPGTDGGSVVSNPPTCELAATLLCVNRADLMTALCVKTSKTSKDTFRVALDVNQVKS